MDATIAKVSRLAASRLAMRVRRVSTSDDELDEEDFTCWNSACNEECAFSDSFGQYIYIETMQSNIKFTFGR